MPKINRPLALFRGTAWLACAPLLAALAGCGDDAEPSGAGASGGSSAGGSGGSSAGSAGSSAGQGGSSQAGSGGSPQAGSSQAGSSQAGGSQAGSGGSAQAGSGGSEAGQGGAGGSAGPGGQGGSAGGGAAGEAGQAGSAGASGASGQGGAGGQAACAVAPISITHQDGTAKEGAFHLLPVDTYPQAVCNDGTPGFYALRPGFGDGARRWIIFLEGGGSCITDEDCQQRSVDTPVYMSSKLTKEGKPATTDLNGIKSTNPEVNPDFYDATVLKIAYCSSDGWSGDKAGDPNLPVEKVGHWHFRGRQIIQAALAEMMQKGLSEATEVFLMGSSAGGVGVINNVDDVAAALPPTARFLAMMDAGFVINYPSFDPATKKESTAAPTTKEAALMIMPAVWGGGGDASCEAAATTAKERAFCRSPYDLLAGGHISTPVFIRQSEHDKIQLKGLIDPGDKLGLTPQSEGVAAYSDRFAVEIAKELTAIAPLPRVAVFAIDSTAHGVINNDDDWKAATVDGLFLPATVGAWYRDPCGTPVKHIAPAP